MTVDLKEFLVQFHDFLAPQLDVYEQAIYLYLFRHSRLAGKEEVVMGFKSARARLATGVGEGGRPMSESTSHKKLESLQGKGCITIVRTSHKGRVLKVHLPSEIPGVVVLAEVAQSQDLETMDFFSVPANRALLLEREGNKCFYTLRPLTPDSFVVEHVISRPHGNNSYRNCVAASREVNNKKKASSAEDFFRRLLREGHLSDTEFADRMKALKLLKAGNLKPKYISMADVLTSKNEDKSELDGAANS
jgi:5-methylcytosine-specific restriction endonuclease McrA